MSREREPKPTSNAERRVAFEQARRDLLALLEGETDQIARMSTVTAVLFERLPQVSFCGFYRVIAPGLLAVGPYQGPVGCLRIEFGRGVCGTAAAEARSIRVDDVRAFPGHISCDPLAQSELVLPVWAQAGTLLAILDLDSHELTAFDTDDETRLKSLLHELFQSD